MVRWQVCAGFSYHTYVASWRGFYRLRPHQLRIFCYFLSFNRVVPTVTLKPSNYRKNYSNRSQREIKMDRELLILFIDALETAKQCCMLDSGSEQMMLINDALHEAHAALRKMNVAA